MKETNPNPFYKFYNFPDFISFSFLYLWTILAVYNSYPEYLIPLIVYSVIGVYILLVLILSRFSFYDEYLKVSFPARFWSRGKTINYSDVLVIKERSFRFDRGFIIIRKGKYFKPELGRPGNSFPCNRKKKREQLIIFLKSKNVEVTKSD